MLSQLEQACKTYSTESFSGLIEFDSNWQRIFVTALTILLDQAIPTHFFSFSAVDYLIPHASACHSYIMCIMIAQTYMQSSLLRQGEKVPLKTFPVSMFNYKIGLFSPKIEVFVQRNQKGNL